MMNEYDLRLMRVTIDLAGKARDKGDHPFGAILVDQQGHILLEAECTVVREKDITGHAESNIIEHASREYDPDFLAGCTLYASTEPCPMCAGAIFWGNVRHVVFGLSQEGLYEIIGEDTEEVLYLPCQELFGKGKKSIEVIGPLLEGEAREVHLGFWQ